jgi:TonB family protein
MLPVRILRLLLLVLPLAACAPAPETETSPAASQSASGVPALQNGREAAQWMDRAFPLLLRDAQVTGEVVMDLTLDAQGNVADMRLVDSSHDAFTDPAESVAPRLRFAPPAQAGQRVRVKLHFTLPSQRVEVVGPAR